MKYNTVRIHFENKKSYATFTINEGERKDTKTEPHALGFYHCPETMTKEEALEQLKQVMLEAHIKEIRRLTKSMKLILKAEFIEF